MEQLLRQLKECIRQLVIISFKIWILTKEKIQQFIEMLKRVFSRKRKLN